MTRNELACAVSAFLLNPWMLGTACLALIQSSYRQWRNIGSPGPGQ